MTRLLDTISAGQTAFGAWLMVSTPAAAEVIAASGFDYLCIDAQHGLLAYDDMRDILLTVKDGPTMLVRVPTNDLISIGKALDAGADGVIVPLVNTGAEAAAAARACAYPPDGNRSFGPLRRQAERPLCFPMVETQDGLDNVDAIASTPGVSGIYVGPADLGLATGTQIFSREHDANCERIRDACTNAGIIAAMHAADGAQAKRRADQGFAMVTVLSDGTMLAKSSRSELEIARS